MPNVTGMAAASPSRIRNERSRPISAAIPCVRTRSAGSSCGVALRPRRCTRSQPTTTLASTISVPAPQTTRRTSGSHARCAPPARGSPAGGSPVPASARSSPASASAGASPPASSAGAASPNARSCSASTVRCMPYGSVSVGIADASSACVPSARETRSRFASGVSTGSASACGATSMSASRTASAGGTGAADASPLIASTHDCGTPTRHAGPASDSTGSASTHTDASIHTR